MAKKRISSGEIQVALSKERTILSKERTILSFMQTGLAFIGIGVVIINVFGISSASQVVGWSLVFIGFVEVLESYRRLHRYQQKIEKIKKDTGLDV
jgi:uncharacterized membrane protein YidH (DUF202 family)